MKLVYDLDGVFRHLTSVPRAGLEANTWDDPLPNGKDIFQHFKENPYHLFYADPYPYVKVVPDNITIITRQVKEWIPYTEKWIRVYIPFANVIYVDTCEEKLELLETKFKGYLLVEDYPYFKDNSRIVVIDRPYNQNVKECFRRIYNPEELQKLMEEE